MTLAEQIAGTWILVSSVDIDAEARRTDTWGSSPLGTYMFDGSGHFAQMVMRSDLPRPPSREQTTPEQAKCIVSGSLAMYGTYAVDEANGLIDVMFTGCTFAAFTGTKGKRKVDMLGPDEMRFSNTGRAGGGRGESVWRRAR